MKKLLIVLFLFFVSSNTFAEPLNTKAGILFFDRTSQTWVNWPSGETGNIALNRMPSAGALYGYDILSNNYDPITTLRPDTTTYTGSSSHSPMMSASFLYGSTNPASPVWVPLLSNASNVLATITCSSSTSCTTTTNLTGDGLASDILANPSASYTLELSGTTWNKIRSDFNQSTTGIVGNGAGTTVTMTTTPMSSYTMIVDRTAGATNAVEIDIECSINNTAFVQIATITDLTNEPALTSVSSIPCRYMRYNIVTVGTGNTLSVDILATR